MHEHNVAKVSPLSQAWKFVSFFSGMMVIVFAHNITAQTRWVVPNSINISEVQTTNEVQFLQTGQANE